MGYNPNMSTPVNGLEPYLGQVVEPSATAGPGPAAAHGLGTVLLDLVYRSGSYHSESDQDAAADAVHKWVNSQVSASEKRALNTDATRAPKEDVSLRVPPGGYVPAVVTATPAIDYDKLAQALVRAGVKPSELCGISR
jgi:hypothetical protein